MTYLTLHRPVANPFRFHNALFTPFLVRPGTEEYKWRPSTDISETDEGFEVRAELPGVTKDDVHISVKDDLLTIKGEKRQEKTDDSKDYQRVERRYGSFERLNAVMGVSSGGFHFHQRLRQTTSKPNSRMAC